MGELSKLTFDQSAYTVVRTQRRYDLHDRYLVLFCFMLAGYATFGKGFAYVGYPPLLIGEVTMLLGLAVIFRSGCGIAMLASLPSLILMTLLVLVMWKAFSGVGPYGLDAIRDSVVVLYSLFAFTVIALLLEKPERLDTLLRWYAKFAFIYALVGGIAFQITTSYRDVLPIWPTSGNIMLDVRPGEAGVHLAGASVFMLLGLGKVPRWWLVPLLISILLVTPSRGAMLAVVVPICAATVLGGKLKRFGSVLLVSSMLFFVGYVAGLEIPLEDGRSIGPEQLVNNFESIIGTSDAANLDGTKEWRLRWWQAIIDYTVHGPYFWTGKGFGMGLAEADGFVVGKELGGPIVRSPHNAHLTMLARTGIPRHHLVGAHLHQLVLADGALLRDGEAARRGAMGGPVPLGDLLSRRDHHRCLVRRRDRGADDRHLVLVAVRAGCRTVDDLPLRDDGTKPSATHDVDAGAVRAGRFLPRAGAPTAGFGIRAISPISRDARSSS